MEELSLYIEEIPEVAKQCMDTFWPGPLTIIMKAKPNVLAPSVTAGLANSRDAYARSSSCTCNYYAH